MRRGHRCFGSMLVVCGLCASPALALRWDFDGESTEGWTAVAMAGPDSGETLRTEVLDGAWRLWLNAVEPGEFPVVRIESPPIQRRLALFDSLTLGVRLLEGGPVPSKVRMFMRYDGEEGERLIATGNRGWKARDDGEGWAEWTTEILGPARAWQAGRDVVLENVAHEFVFARFNEDRQLVPLGDDTPAGFEVGWVLLTGEGEASAHDTAVEEAGSSQPAGWHLGAAYPNPFNGSTALRLMVPRTGGEVWVGVYNGLGQRVRALHDGPVSAGEYVVRWDGRGDDGRPVASGAYVVRVQGPGLVSSRKVALTQ